MFASSVQDRAKVFSKKCDPLHVNHLQMVDHKVNPELSHNEGVILDRINLAMGYTNPAMVTERANPAMDFLANKAAEHQLNARLRCSISLRNSPNMFLAHVKTTLLGRVVKIPISQLNELDERRRRPSI